MLKYKTIIFDLDGTILDTAPGVIESIKYMIQQLNLEEITEDEMRTFIGPPLPLSLKKHYQLEGEKLEEAADVFRTRYSTANV